MSLHDEERSIQPGGHEMTQQCASTQRGAAKWTAPRTPWGDPDFQGISTKKDENTTPFEHPPELAGNRGFENILKAARGAGPESPLRLTSAFRIVRSSA